MKKKMKKNSDLIYYDIVFFIFGLFIIFMFIFLRSVLNKSIISGGITMGIFIVVIVFLNMCVRYRKNGKE